MAWTPPYGPSYINWNSDYTSEKVTAEIIRHDQVDPRMRVRPNPVEVQRAAKLLVEMLPRRAIFPILGADRDGLESGLRREAIAAGIDDRVHFLGFRDPVEPWLAAADVLLAPAVEDAFGRTLVEAVQVGTPVVAAFSGGHTEILADGRTGILVQPDDASALAAAAHRVLTEPGLGERLTAAARAEVSARYTLAHHVDAITSLYRRLSRTDDHARPDHHHR